MTTIRVGRILVRLGCGLLFAFVVGSPPRPCHAAPIQVPREEAKEGLGYKIGAGDVLQVFVWKEPELTRDLTVRLDGRITVPLLGDIRASGRTPEQISAELTEKLGRYVEAPVVTVAVLQANSARFFVIGQVAQPGGFPLAGQMTVLQGLALAGGFKEFAKTDRILVIREEEGASASAITVNYKKLEEGTELLRNVPLQPGDTILVP